MALTPAVINQLINQCSLPSPLTAPVGPGRVLEVKLRQGNSPLPSPEPMVPRDPPPPVNISGEDKDGGSWGPGGSAKGSSSNFSHLKTTSKQGPGAGPQG